VLRSFIQFKVASVWTSWQHVQTLLRVREDSSLPLQTQSRKTSCTCSGDRAIPSRRGPCYENYVKTECNHLDSRETPSGHGLNMEKREVRYGKLVAQKTIRTLPREIRDRLDLGLLGLQIEGSRHVFFTEFSIEFSIA
jgi:hypothetical protein